jgi:hypothetical protein
MIVFHSRGAAQSATLDSSLAPFERSERRFSTELKKVFEQ